MLRVSQRTDASCPVCKASVTRRNVQSSALLRNATEAFGFLAEAFEKSTGHSWEDLVDDPVVFVEEEESSLDSKENQISNSQDDFWEVLARDHFEVGSSARSSPRTSRLSTVSDDIHTSRLSNVSDVIPPSQLSKETSASSTIKKSELNSEMHLCMSKSRLDLAKISSSLGTFSYSDAFDVKKTTHLIMACSLPNSQSVDELQPCDLRDQSITSRLVHRNNVNRSLVAASRTVKYMKAVLSGCWIVSEQWLVDSVAAGRFLDEQEYELLGDEVFPNSEGAKKARQSLCRFSKKGMVHEHRLFQNRQFLLIGEFLLPPRNVLIELIQMGGGSVMDERQMSAVMRRKRRRLCSDDNDGISATAEKDGDDSELEVIVICDGSVEQKKSFGLQTLRPFRTSYWLMACISNYNLVDPTASDLYFVL